jgi:hypothetical protein
VLSNLKILKNVIAQETINKLMSVGDSPSEYIGTIVEDVGVFIDQEFAEEEVQLEKIIAEEEARIAEEKRIAEVEAARIAEEKRIAEAEASMVSIPANAYASDDSWKCNAGFYKNNNYCFKLPSNAIAKAYSDGFYCKSGYEKSGNSCIKKISIPANAHSSGAGWECNSGYQKSGNNCVKTTSMSGNETPQLDERTAYVLGYILWYSHNCEVIYYFDVFAEILDHFGLFPPEKLMNNDVFKRKLGYVEGALAGCAKTKEWLKEGKVYNKFFYNQ